MTRRPLVYMAHPYSSDPQGNVRASMQKWDGLMEAGVMDVINPLWSHAQHCEIQRPYEFWLEYDLRLIERCDAVYRLPGNSPGADREVAHAESLGIRVFLDITSLFKWCERWIAKDTKSTIRQSRTVACSGDCDNCPCNAALPVDHSPDAGNMVSPHGESDRTGEIQHDRQQVYGDPLENHRGIAMQWAPMLQPHWERIRDMQPLPPHVVAMLMALVKINRMRLVYHADNYDDLEVYLQKFAREWQQGNVQ